MRHLSKSEEGVKEMGRTETNLSIFSILWLFGKLNDKQQYSSVFGIKIKSHSSSVSWDIYLKK